VVKSLLVRGVEKSLLVRCVEGNLVDTVDEGVPVQFASRLFLAPVGSPKQKCYFSPVLLKGKFLDILNNFTISKSCTAHSQLKRPVFGRREPGF
jgi:hypothetical protein